nr:U3 small nucleolar RNA interacting protein 2 [Hymenolepis microstoma]
MSEGRKSKAAENFDEIPSEESATESDGDQQVDDYEEDEEIETPHEKRVRLAKLALAKSKQAIGSDDEDPMATLTVRLQEEALQARGKLFFRVAEKFSPVSPESIICLFGHRKTVTCLCISSDTKYIFSGGKDASIIKWSINDFSKTKIVRGGRKGSSSPFHTGPLLAIAISDDCKYLATGSADRSIIIWNPETLEVLFRLQRHRSPVTALSFQRQSHMMFSGDKFGRVCVWNLPLTDILQDQGAATKIEVLSICGLSSERCISASGFGGAGICLWKVEQEVCVQYVVKNPAEYAIECIYAVNDDLYIGGSATNTLYLWHVSRGSPICKISPAHPYISSDLVSVKARPALNWITAVTGLFSTDLLATGSSSGHVQLWRLHLESEKAFSFGFGDDEGEEGSDEESKPRQTRVRVHHDSAKLERIPNGEFHLGGFVNSLAFSNDGKWLVAGIGQEHRLGRWEERRKVRDAVCLIPINIPFKQACDIWA